METKNSSLFSTFYRGVYLLQILFSFNVPFDLQMCTYDLQRVIIPPTINDYQTYKISRPSKCDHKTYNR